MLTKDDIKELGKKQNVEIINKIKKLNNNFVIMPAGVKAKNLYNILEELNIKPKFFIDNSTAKHGTSYNDTKIISLDDYQKLENKPIVVIAANNEFGPQIIEQLKKANISYIIDDFEFIFNKHETFNADEIFIENYNRYINLYNSLSDEKSKIILDNILKFRLTLDCNYITESMKLSTVQYFEPDIYKISSNDSIVDCGAYIGDTYEYVDKLLNGKIKNYYMFEPDENNFEKIKKYLSDNVEIYKKGCWSKETTLQFTNDGNSASKISDEGIIKIPVTSLDEQLKNKEVTFIKMDIEGAEIEALKGSKNIIQNQNPTLAICVYHKFMDIFDIPELIQSCNTNYKYFLRHYHNTNAETVLYTIPKQ